MQNAIHPADPTRLYFLRTGIPPTRASTQLAAEVQRAREQEREHLARELHDVLGGELTAARLQVASLKSRLAGQSADIDQRLEQLDATLHTALALKRRILDGLEPVSLHVLGLTASLEAMAREFAESSGVHLATDLDEVTADAATELAIYRLVQESLTNMAKYAAAGEADIVLRDRGGKLEIFVRDNGCGFGPAHGGSPGHGLRGMRHRIESAGGHLTVESEPGKGTRIAATLPKHRPEARITTKEKAP